MKKQTFSKLAALIVTLALLAILLSQIEVADVVDTLTGIDPVYLVAGFGLYVLSYFFRALRFYLLLNREVGIKDLFNIVCIHNMVNNLLPARTGELSFVYLLKKRHTKTVGTGAATLIIARLFDMITILTLFLLSTLSVSSLFNIYVEVRYIAVALIVGIMLVLLTIIHRGPAFVTSLRRIANYFGMDKVCFVDYIFKKMDETIESFSDMHRSTFIWSALVSILIWIVLYSMNYTLITAMGIDMNFLIVLFASTFAIITTILPVQGIGGFGTFESGWVIGSIAVGLTREAAVSSGFALHLIGLFYVLVLGIMGMYVLPQICFKSHKFTLKIK